MKPASGQSGSMDRRPGLLLRNWKKLSYKVTVECFDIGQVYHYKRVASEEVLKRYGPCDILKV